MSATQNDQAIDPVARVETTATDPAQVIQSAPMSRVQFAILINLFVLYALDGFDVLSIAFALPGIRSDWGVSSAALGVAISLGLLGTGLGSLCVAPLSDHWGRKPTILLCLGAMTGGMFASAFCHNIEALSAARLVTGIGIGGLLPAVSALAAEYSNINVRSRAVAFVSIGFPAGGFFGGGVAALLLSWADWQAIFLFGAAASAVMVAVTWRLVPESVEFLAARRPPLALARINRIFARLQLPALDSLPAVESSRSRPSLFQIFTPLLLVTTLTVTLTYTFHNATFYYAVNWLPKLAVDFGFTSSEAAGIAAWCSAGGIAGAIVIAWLAGKIEVARLTVATLCASAIALAALVHFGGTDLLFLIASIVLGVCIYGGQVSLYALMMKSFPVHARATGAGFVTGVGRLGGILSPAVSGYLFSAGMGNTQVSTIMAFGSVIGAAALLLGGLWMSGSRRPDGASTA